MEEPSQVSGMAAESGVSDDDAPSRLRAYAPALLIFVAGLATSIAWAAYAQQLHSGFVKAEFTRRASLRVRVLQSEIDDVVDQLFATAAFFASSREVEADEFRRFVEPLLERHPGIRAIEWAPRVVGPGGAESFPVTYLVPLEGNESVLGFDLASEPTRAEGLSEARESRRVATSGPLQLLQAKERGDGYLVFLPHYAQSQGDSDDGAENLLGFIVGVVSLKELVDESVARIGMTEFRVELQDGGRVVAEFLSKDGDLVPGSIPALEEHLRFADRKLLISLRAGRRFMVEQATVGPEAGLAAGVVLSLTIASYFLTLRREQRARQRATNRLRESERRSRILIENAPDAIVVYDVDSDRIVDANANAVALTGLPRERLLDRSILDVSPASQLDGTSSKERFGQIADRALVGDTPPFDWLIRNDTGAVVPCELRLVRLPSGSRRQLRASFVDNSTRVEAEQRRKRLTRELDHRVKNTLANVLAIAEQTSASAKSLSDFRESFAGRLRAMARAHEAIAESQWREIPFADLVRIVLAGHVGHDGRRIVRHGPPVAVSPEAASSLSLVFHELGTNACKHGGLTSGAGTVDLAWELTSHGNLVIDWRESGDPAGSPTELSHREGVGLRLIRGIAEHELGGTVRFERGDGSWACHMVLPAECLAPKAGDESAQADATPQ